MEFGQGVALVAARRDPLRARRDRDRAGRLLASRRIVGRRAGGRQHGCHQGGTEQQPEERRGGFGQVCTTFAAVRSITTVELFQRLA